MALPRNEDRRTGAVLGRLGAAMAPLPDAARRSITFDRGLEFTGWHALAKRTGVGVWFCDPQAPHQKGAVEKRKACSQAPTPLEHRHVGPLQMHNAAADRPHDDSKDESDVFATVQRPVCWRLPMDSAAGVRTFDGR